MHPGICRRPSPAPRAACRRARPAPTLNTTGSRTRSEATRPAGALLLALFGIALIAFNQTASAQDRPTVYVSTVAQLYAAVNDPANADTLIVLAPGVYTLSSIAPNGGTLLLQPHMALAGYNEYQDVDGDGVWDEVYWPAEGGFPVTPAFARPKTETIIDGTQLTINAGVVRAGRLDGQQEADNSLSGLTVIGGLLPAGTGAAEVSVRALPLGSSIRVTDCVLEKGQRGILLTSVLNNVTSHLVAERNIIRENASSRGWGIHLDPEGSNGIALSNVSLTAELRHNRFYNNRVGLNIVSIGTDDSENIVVSHSNIYDSQSPGAIPGFGAGIFTQISSSSANTHRSRNKLISNNDTIVNNVGNGGVFAMFQAPGGNALEDSEINLSFVGTVFVKLNAAGGLDGNQNRTVLGKRADVSLIDLTSNSPSGPNISGNRLTILLRQTFTSSAPIPTDSNPKPFIITDRADVTPDQVAIRVIGNEVSFKQTNSGFNIPTGDFTGNGPDGN